MCKLLTVNCGPWTVNGRKGQVGETITWVIATIIIVVVLMFFVFGATALGATKSIGKFKPSLLSVEVGVGDDQFLKKSLFTYVKTGDQSTKKLIDRSLNKSYVDYGFGLSYDDVKKEVIKRYGSGN